MTERLGDAPIELEYMSTMNSLARVLDDVLNGKAKGTNRKVGFVLLVFPFGEKEGRCATTSAMELIAATSSRYSRSRLSASKASRT